MRLEPGSGRLRDNCSNTRRRSLNVRLSRLNRNALSPHSHLLPPVMDMHPGKVRRLQRRAGQKPARKRGDSITIIPTTGDTLTESQGTILRIHLPENRKVYDSDLAKLATEVEEKLKRMQAEATANPYQHSDILGAADLAAQELATEKGNVHKVIVILSDFIQDDSRLNFNNSPDLANEHAGVALAKKLSTNHREQFAETNVYLGLLRSKDLKKMPNPRREAMQTFWLEYFKTCSAQSVVMAIDGPGKIASALGQTE